MSCSVGVQLYLGNFSCLAFHLGAVNRSLDAIQASATQVRLESDSEAAKRNAVFYQQRPGVTRKDFIPRQVEHLKTTTVVL